MCLPGVYKEHPVQLEALQGGPQQNQQVPKQEGCHGGWEKPQRKMEMGTEKDLCGNKGLILKREKFKTQEYKHYKYLLVYYLMLLNVLKVNRV